MQKNFRTKHLVLMTSLVVMVSLLFFAGISFASSAALTDDTYADSIQNLRKTSGINRSL